MTLAAAVKQQILAGVADLAGSVEEIADLVALVEQSALPQKPRAAFVLPLGFNGGPSEAVTGLYRQTFNEVIGVVLVVQTVGDPKAQKALAIVDALRDAIIGVVAGWAPAGAMGVFSVMRGRLVSVTAGTVIYQIDFSLQNQLRIA